MLAGSGLRTGILPRGLFDVAAKCSRIARCRRLQRARAARTRHSPVAAPGQFVMVKVGLGARPVAPAAIFRVRTPSLGRFAFWTLAPNKRIGPSTARVHAASGQRLACLGPLGLRFRSSSHHTDAWMVAGGVGGPLPHAGRSFSLRARGVRCTLFYGARRGRGVVLSNPFQDLTSRRPRNRGMERRRDGRVTAPLGGASRSARAPRRQACGPEGMLAATAKIAMRYGRRGQVSVERVMGCRVGRLLQLRRSDAHRSRGLSPCAIVLSGRCSQEIRDTVGLRSFNTMDTKDTKVIPFCSLSPKTCTSSQSSLLCPWCPSC